MKRALSLVVLAAAAGIAAGCGATTVAVVVSHSDSSAVPLHGPVLGGEVTVVAFSKDHVLLCTSTWNDGVFHSPPQPPCRSGIRAVGVHVGALAKQEGQSSRWGPLYLVGRYAGGTFYVTSQRHWAPTVRTKDPMAKPPCPTPRGGWRYVRSGEQLHAVNHYRRLTGHRDITSLAYFGGEILTLASTHPARTRAVVGRYGHNQLCVVKSRYTPLVIRDVRHRAVRILTHFGMGKDAATWGWPSGAGGQSVSRTGQPTTPLDVFVVTPRLQAFLDRQPPGVIRVEAALHPLGR